MPDRVMTARAGLHYYEEPYLSGTNGSGTVFFSGCSLGCIYCQNWQISRDNYGLETSTDRLAEIFLEQQDDRNAHNINLVTATHFTPSVVTALKKAKDKGLKIPVIWNSSGYEKPETLRLLDGLVDVFLPDFKTMSAELGARYMNAPDYPKWAKEAVACMFEMTGETKFRKIPDKNKNDLSGSAGESVIQPDGEDVLMIKGVSVRHLVIPGHSQDSKEVVQYLYETYGDSIWMSIMRQYTPMHDFGREYPELMRTISDREYDKVVDYAIDLGVSNCMIQDNGAESDSFIPVFDGTGVF